jgi:hypothetical protein
MGFRDELNPYSRRFADRLFALYPQWEHLAKLEPWPNADPGCFLVEVSSPVDPERQLSVGTDGEEITVGFGPHGWHAHYGAWTGADEESSFVEALEEIAGILEERLVVAVGTQDGQTGASTLIPAGEDPGLNGYDRIDYVSWRGSHDRSVPA